jgi:replicative DNA helicase
MSITAVLAELIDTETERLYVSAALYDWQVTRLVRVEPADVASESLREILAGCYATERADGNWTASTVAETLSKRGTLDRVGGQIAIDMLRDGVDPQTLMNPERVAGRIRLLAERRRESATATALSEALKMGDRERAAKLLDELNAIRQTSVGEVEILTSKETTEAAYKYLVDYAESKRHIALGVRELDAVVGRLPSGTMAVIGGSTGAGKSQTMLWMAMSMAKAGNRPGIISLEDAREEWGGRIIARTTDITFRDFADARGRGPDERAAIYSKAGEAVDEAGKHMFDIAYAISADTDVVVETARKLISERGCNVLFVDYVQAIRIGHEWVKRIDKGVSDAAKRLKGICARLKVPLVLGSQLARSNDAPTIHSLKETGDLENEAEVVILLWRKDDGTRNPPTHWKVGKVKWASARPKGKVLFDRSTGMIEDFVGDDGEDEIVNEDI